MAHCLSPMGLCQRQKNEGEEEKQERVRGEPSLVIVPNLGNLDTISIPHHIKTSSLSFTLTIFGIACSTHSK